MQRVVVIGNSGGGKLTLARQIAQRLGLPYIEIDSILWKPGWQLAEDYQANHDKHIAQDRWVMDGLGTLDSIPARLQRATDIVLIDLPLWMHFWLAAERHMAWSNGKLDVPPAGSANPPPMKAMFEMIWNIDQNWMPRIREWVESESRGGKQVHRLLSLEDLDGQRRTPSTSV